MKKIKSINNCERKLLINEEEGTDWKMGMAENICWGDVSMKFLREKHYALLYLKNKCSAHVLTFSLSV